MNILELLKPYYNPDNGDKVLNVYIVGPYPTEEFFYNLFENISFDYRRKNIVNFLVDKSAYEKALEIKKSIVKRYPCKDSQFNIKAISGDNGRFVHSKIYYFKIEKSDGKEHTCLITGSGNASTRAYSFGNNEYANAEVNIVSRILQKDREFIENYFDIENREENQDDTYILNLDSEDVKVYFPKIKEVRSQKKEEYSNFTNWILNGYIYHKYTRANDIWKVRIKLEKEIAGENVFTQLIEKHKFSSSDKIKSISYSYVDVNGISNGDDKDEKDTVKKYYLCETAYGYWAPRELKENIDSEISNQDKTYSTELLNTIKRLSDYEIETKTDEIVKEICNIFKDLNESQRSYFKVKGKNLDESYYREDIKSQILRQRNRCQNKNFYERFIYGYDSFNVSYLENCIDDLTDEVFDFIETKLDTSDKLFNKLCSAVNNVIVEENKSLVEVLKENLNDIISNLKNEM